MLSIVVINVEKVQEINSSIKQIIEASSNISSITFDSIKIVKELMNKSFRVKECF